MKTKFRFFCIWILVLALLSSCATSMAKSDRAAEVLRAFFDHLAQGEYEAAASLYGGSYETLVVFNPDLDPDDYTALWQRGCQVNGLQCLPVRTVTFNEVTLNGEYIFTVEFSNPDDSLFVLGACCGEHPTMPHQFQFEYRVVAGSDGSFLILDLPIYIP